MLEFNALVLIDAGMHAREIINGGLFILCANLAGLIVYFMIRTYSTCPVGVDWKQVPGMATACILSWLFGIIAFRCGFAWLALKLTNDGYRMIPSLELFATWSLVISALILVAITLRATYIWTPPEWHNKAWLASGCVAALFVLVSEWF